MCVNHLKRCKTSNLAGGHSISLGLCPTKLPVKWDIQLGQLDVPAPFSNFVNGDRLSQVPACRLNFQFSLWFMLHLNLPQSFVSNRSPTTVRFLQSDLLLTSSDGSVAPNQDDERIFLYWFSRLVILVLLSDFTGLFVHVRCIPHQ